MYQHCKLVSYSVILLSVALTLVTGALLMMVTKLKR